MSENKNKKISMKKTNYVLSIILALVIGASGMFVTNTYIINNSEKNKGNENIPELDQEAYSQFLFDESDELSSINKMFTILKTNYFEELDSKELVEGALIGMAEAVDDPYTEYLNEEETASFEEDISGSFQGIGAEVMKDNEAVRIVSPIANSPAEKAGLQANDLILEINGESIADYPLNEAVSLIRGPEGTEVKLLIQRGDEKFTVELIRDDIPIETVFSEVDEDDSTIGYVNIVNFNLPTYEETVEAIQKLEKDGVTKIIFDVRGNPGGLLSTALEIANIFVPEGEPLLMTETREDAEPFVYYANNEEYGDFKYDGDAVLLVDQGSASASEILAGAMQSVDIPVYGETTFGKGTVQSVVSLDNDDEVKFTNGKWLTAAGEWINEEGIKPDEIVSLPEYAKLFVITPNESFEKNQKSSEIKNLKSILRALDYDVSDNDEFDDSVIEAIHTFQKSKDLKADGKVNSETARKLTDELRDLIEDNDTQYDAAKEDFQ